MIFVNFKTYEQGSGHNALKLVKSIEELSISASVKIIPVVQTIDAEILTSSSRLEIWTQHVDPISYGANTGFVLPEEIVRVGVKGVFLNHSEHKFPEFEDLRKAVARCKEVDLKTLVFADNVQELEKISELKPDFVSYEPPELVGSSDSSVSESQPEIIDEAVAVAKSHNLPLIVGAGIKSTNDVRVCVQKGAAGIAVASSVVKSENQIGVLKELLLGFEI